MPDFTVHQYGTDTSGRGIFMTTYMHDWWEQVVTALGFRPTIVQGAFMVRNGGGAAASAGYHDAAGCIDVRTWDLTGSQIDALVRTVRTHGAAAWRRDKTPLHGGMDSHCHITLGSDQPLSAGAAASWRSYLDGRNGLANNAPDYEWRPSPLVTNPPAPITPKEDVVTPEDINAVADLVVTKLLAHKIDAKSGHISIEQAITQAANAPGVVRTEVGKIDGPKGS